MRANLGIYLFACCSATFSAAAQAPQPSAEFWEYLLEFSDENGELIDPLEYAQLNEPQMNKLSDANEQTNLSRASTEAMRQSTTQSHSKTSRDPRPSSSAEESSQ